MTNTRRLSMIALLASLSFLLMYFDFPILPMVSFLKIEFSILPILIGLVVLDLRGAVSILFLRSLLKLLLHNQGVNTYIGLPMNMIAIGVYVFVFALIWKRNQTSVRFWLAGFLGSLGLTVAMVLLNYIYAIPLYAHFANFDIGMIFGISQYLFSMVVPFNLIEGAIFTTAFWFSYLLIKPVLPHYEP